MAQNKKKKHQRPQQRKAEPKPVRLSQVMIVKNEEKNIERALKWAKGIAFEQIVVDTGSTDRTVEIAEKMGAKVFHFTWINDFGAAKNYAIEQASGNWIAFLDADEFFVDKEVPVVMEYLDKINREHPAILGIVCPWVCVDESKDMEIQLIGEQMRLFRNKPNVRYVGKIHEAIPLHITQHVKTTEFSILHTGYTPEEYKDKAKGERNVELLRKAVEDYPDNANYKAYLAEALRTSEGGKKEAREIYRALRSSGTQFLKTLMLNMYVYSMMDLFNEDLTANRDEIESLALEAMGKFPEAPDPYYYYAVVLFKKKDFENAWLFLNKCADALKKLKVGVTNYVSVPILYNSMLRCAYHMGREDEMPACARNALKDDPYRTYYAAQTMLYLYDDCKYPEEKIASFMLNLGIYKMDNVNDLIFLTKAAKESGIKSLAQCFLALLTAE
ncbi:MAG: glycosyltransferase family 2 protein [Oscillospiraceae bacterium]|jgi:glycosyltransferase involved in cell wall biosynthesis|nr:glycosyltransferase family 2 protein [Oscillospiraceae bacterium]